MIEIPEDILNIAEDLWYSIELGEGLGGVSPFGRIARALLAERERATMAERERCANIAYVKSYRALVVHRRIAEAEAVAQGIAAAIRSGEGEDK